MTNTNWRIEYGYNSVKDNPCKPNCPNRSAECRLFCECFKVYEEKRRIEEAERNKRRDAAMDFSNYKYTIASRIRKRKHL